MITEYIIGYIYPGFPAANICFKVYGYISMKQGIIFLQDLKLGHYMKIPPRAMFMAQVGFPSFLLIGEKKEQDLTFDVYIYIHIYSPFSSMSLDFSHIYIYIL